ncbi:MAG: NAD(P)-dependent oxidoreductase [Rhodospirillales bacterium]|nr:NAD(P)-dependent oxidoreductase [Rhodospirillales bacterium]
MSAPTQLGFIGLGQMGGPMAENISGFGLPLHVFDAAGTTERTPAAGLACESVDDVAAKAETIFLSLPDGPVSCAVAGAIAASANRVTTVIVDLSTVGPDAARQAGEICAAAGITYIDAPVSGGALGAKAGSITIMWAGPEAEFTRHQPVMASFSKNQFHVGDQPGQGQALKILNNFLSATAMAATSEAMLFGLSQGLDMKVMLDVVNVSTGQNSASLDKFPKRILTETYDAGFKSALMAKDVKLYYENTRAAHTPGDVGGLISKLWNSFDEAQPGSDFTRVFEFIRDRN